MSTTALEVADLPLDVGAAVEGSGLETDGSGQRAQDLDDLASQFACRHQHKCSGPESGGARLGALDQWQPEGERLARAGAGLAAHVAPGQRVADRELLDRERLEYPLFGKCAYEFGAYAEVSKGGHVLLLSPSNRVACLGQFHSRSGKQ